MTITTVSIACDVGLPDNTEFTASRLDFTLSGPDYDTVSNDAIPAATVSVALDASGIGTALLWPVDRGVRNTKYSVTLVGSRTVDGRVQAQTYSLGTISPPSAVSPHDLADLLAQSSGGIVVGSTIYETLADAVAAAIDAEAAAVAAAETAAENAAAGADPIAAIAARDAAIAAADAAAASYDSFDDRYLGAKASDPALDNDGDALIIGALYWNTVSDAMRVWDGAAWVPVVPLGALIASNNLSDVASATTARSNLGAQATITGAATTITSANLTGSRALVSNGSGKVAVSEVTGTQLGYVAGVTSAIQTQLNIKAPVASPALTGTPTAPTAAPATNTNQIATTAFVLANAPSIPSQTQGTWNVGTNTVESTISALKLDDKIENKLNAAGAAPLYACRAWVNFNGAGTVAIRAAGNVSSITDNGTGDYTVNFTTALLDADYAMVGSAEGVLNHEQLGVSVKRTVAPTTTSARVSVGGTGGNGSASNQQDSTRVFIAIFR